MTASDVMQDLSMSCMSDHGSVMDNLSFDDFDPSQDFFEDFTGRGGGKTNEAGGTAASVEDVYVQLEQKEKDLILAAELGKALLERNEELTMRQDQLQQEMADKMEELEQEKHHLRRRLETLGGEYESKLLDLQTEIATLHKELANQKAVQKTLEKDKQTAVNELSEQNQRLVHKLKQASGVEEELNEHIQRLRDQVHLRRQHSLHRENTHVTEDLQQEVQRLSAKRGELERRLHTTINDRDTLGTSLEETSEKCQVLEQQCRDLQQELQLRDSELSQLRQSHNDMAEELEELRCQVTLNASSKSAGFLANSLLSELGGFEMAGPGDLDDSNDCEGGDRDLVLGSTAAGVSPRLPDPFDDDDIECDDVDGQAVVMALAAGGSEENQEAVGDGSVGGNRGVGRGVDDAVPCRDDRCHLERQQLEDVLNEVHTTLSRIVQELKAFQVSSSPIGSPHHSPRPLTNRDARQEHAGTRPSGVRNLLRDLTTVTDNLTDRLHLQATTDASTRGATGADAEALECHIEALRAELSGTQAHIELLQGEINRRDDELKRKDSELGSVAAKTRHTLTQILYSEVRSLERELKLTSPSSSADCSTSCDEIDLSSVSSEDDKLEGLCMLNPGRRASSSEGQQDLSSSVSQEEIIDRLQSERDEAVVRRSAIEQELFQAKSDMVKLDDQLIWAIKQKASLSEQLDQWQLDIHQLLDQGLKKQLTRQEVRKLDAKKPKTSPQRRFPSFWS